MDKNVTEKYNVVKEERVYELNNASMSYNAYLTTTKVVADFLTKFTPKFMKRHTTLSSIQSICVYVETSDKNQYYAAAMRDIKRIHMARASGYIPLLIFTNAGNNDWCVIVPGNEVMFDDDVHGDKCHVLFNTRLLAGEDVCKDVRIVNSDIINSTLRDVGVPHKSLFAKGEESPILFEVYKESESGAMHYRTSVEKIYNISYPEQLIVRCVRFSDKLWLTTSPLQ